MIDEFLTASLYQPNEFISWNTMKEECIRRSLGLREHGSRRKARTSDLHSDLSAWTFDRQRVQSLEIARSKVNGLIVAVERPSCQVGVCRSLQFAPSVSRAA